jgi:hypothetical protein
MTAVNPVPSPIVSSPVQPNKLQSLVNSVAFDFAGLGCIGAGIYALLFTKDSAAYTTLIALGAGYLGFKAPNPGNN